jgi:RNA polymerase sigma-70 factor (ECF subfamily)
MRVILRGAACVDMATSLVLWVVPHNGFLPSISEKTSKLAHALPRILPALASRDLSAEYVEFSFGLIYPLVIHRSSPQEFEGSVGSAPPSHVSELLLHWGNGDRKALEAILPLVYNELRRLARYHLRRQRPNHTLQTTALVHEAYLRLAREKLPPIENRVHFLGLAAQLMRWILVDYERNRRAAKRGAGATRLTLDPTVAALRSHRQDVDLLALDEALDRLAKLDGQQSQIIELRYFAGLSIEDTSEFLGISPATVKRSWSSARAWLLREIGRGEARA